MTKYQIDESNEFIDQTFEKYYNSYKKKREYDNARYKQNQGKHIQEIKELTEELDRVKKQNVEYQQYLERFLDYHKKNNLPPIKKK